MAIGSSSTVSGGVITDGPVGTGTLTLAGGTTLRSDSTTSRIIKNNVSASGLITLGDATNTGSLTFSAAGLTTPSTFALTADTTFNTLSNVNISQAVTGNFVLTKSGTANLALNTANSYSGGTVINQGTLALNNNAALGSTTASVTVNGGSLAIQGTSPTIGVLSGSGGSVQNVGVPSGTLTVGNGGGSGSYAGTISNGAGGGTLSLTKTAAGTQTLTGNNTFTGATIVSASGGTLEAAANGALGSGTTGTSGITVNSGGTLLLSNSTATDRVKDTAGITLNGGTLAKGAGVNEGSTSTVGMGALTLTAVSSAISFTQSSGTLTFNSFAPGAFVLSITNYIGNGSPGGTDQLIFNQDQGPSGANQLANFDFGFGAGVNVAEAILGGGFFEIYTTTPIPEPSTWVGGSLALAMLLFTQRHRFTRLIKRA